MTTVIVHVPATISIWCPALIMLCGPVASSVVHATNQFLLTLILLIFDSSLDLLPVANIICTSISLLWIHWSKK